MGRAAKPFGADQFVPRDGDPSGAPAVRSSYFNWFHFSISWGYAIATAGLSYVQDNAGWTVGFGACWAVMVLYLAVFLLGTPTYRAKQPADGGPFAETVRAWVARVFRRNDNNTRTERRLLAPKREEGLIVKLLPIWLTSIVFAAIFSQVSTLFTKQASTLDRRLGGATGRLVVPPAALQCLTNITFIVMLPLYDRVIVPLARRLTGHAVGITMLQRIGASMAAACAAMAVAALVEARRLRVARDAGLIDRPDVPLRPWGLWWMIPQYVLIGLAGVLGQVGLEEFFYDQVPDALRSVGLALCLCIFGVGSYASSALVSAIDWATRSKGESWFSDNLNRAHLDYFYWLLAGLAALEVTAFVYVANRYVYRNKGASCT
ncbi:unnamed protein product [Urochloa humidicola]